MMPVQILFLHGFCMLTENAAEPKSPTPTPELYSLIELKMSIGQKTLLITENIYLNNIPVL